MLMMSWGGDLTNLVCDCATLDALSTGPHFKIQPYAVVDTKAELPGWISWLHASNVRAQAWAKIMTVNRNRERLFVVHFTFLLLTISHGVYRFGTHIACSKNLLDHAPKQDDMGQSEPETGFDQFNISLNTFHRSTKNIFGLHIAIVNSSRKTSEREK